LAAGDGKADTIHRADERLLGAGIEVGPEVLDREHRRGKSVTALSVLGLVGGSPGAITGAIEFGGDNGRRNLLQDLGRYVTVTERDGRIVAVAKDEPGWRAQLERSMARVRGNEIAMIFQNPKSSL